MSEVGDKYLAQMLEGIEQNLPQVDAAIEGMTKQLQQMKDQKAQMEEGITELKDLLGLDSEEASPLKLVTDEEA